MTQRHAQLLAWMLGLGLLQVQTQAQGPSLPQPPSPSEDRPPSLRVVLEPPAKEPEKAPSPAKEPAKAPAPALPPAAKVEPPAQLPSSEPRPAPGTVVPSVPFGPKTSSSTSTSRQFTVHGADLALRSAFCILCEETADSLGRVLKDGGKFVLPVVVVLHTPPDITIGGPAVSFSIGELTHGGFHLQINAQLRAGFHRNEFSRQLVLLLLAERILRDHQKLNTTRKNGVLPAWVMTGVSQALEYRSRSRPSALFSAVFKRGQVYSLDNILTADPTEMDALTRGIYDTSTCALVLTLIDQPEGPVRFTKFLSALASDNKSDRDLLMQHFPNLGTSKSALEKWWSLQMAALATPSAMEAMSVAQTEEELDEALMLAIPVSESGSKKKAEPPPVSAAPPAPEAEAKKGGIFGWMKRDRNDADAPEKTGEAKPQDGNGGGSGGPPASDAKAKAQGMPTAAVEFRNIENLLFPYAPLLSAVLPDVFEGGQEVALFKKKPKPEDAPAEAGKEKEKDAKKPEPPKTEAKPKEEPLPSLSRKPGTNRSIGNRPSDLPSAPPVTEKPSAPAPAPATAKSQTPEELEEKPRPGFGFLFRKKDKETAEEKPEEDKPSPAKPEPPKIASKPAPTPAPAPPPEPPKTQMPEESGNKPRPGFGFLFRKKDKETPEGNPAEGQPAPAKAEPKPEPPKVASKPAPAPAPPRTAKPGSIPIEDFALIAKRADRSEILNRCINRLSALKLRAHPLYKPLITEYSAVAQELAQGKTRGASTKLESLRKEREAIHEKALAVETYLDWYEANHSGTLSRAFDDFFRLDEELQKERMPRNDAFSKDLDAAQKEFGR